MRPPEVLTGARLRLRRPRPDDADAIFAGYATDAEVTRYLSWNPHTEIDQTHDFLARSIAAWEGEQLFPFVITTHADDQALGMIHARVDGHRVELGYVVARAEWGQGIATEAVRTIVDWALGEPGIARVWAYVDVDNAASCRVLEKAGLVREELLHRWASHPNVATEPRDAWCYATWPGAL